MAKGKSIKSSKVSKVSKVRSPGKGALEGVTGEEGGGR